MLKKTCFFFFLTLNLILKGCTNASRTNYDECAYNEDTTKEINLIEKISIPITAKDNFMSFQTIVKGDSIIRENYFNSTLDIYSFKEKKLIVSYHYKNEGPNSILKFGGAGILYMGDNKFMFGSMLGRIYETIGDSVVSKVNLNEKYLFRNKEYRLYGVNKERPMRIGNKVLFHKIPQYVQTDTDSYYSESLIVSYDLDLKELNELNVFFPKHYRYGLWSFAHIRPSMTLNDKNEVILSFPTTSDLYRYDIKLDTMTLIEKCTKSRYDQKPIKPLKDFNAGFYKVNQYIKENVCYQTLVFDQFKKLYYRILALPTSNSEDIVSQDKAYMVSPLVLMILDEDFNVLAEKKLEPKRFNYNDYFVNKKGFWLSNNNPRNPEFNEDELSFSLFRVVQK